MSSLRLKNDESPGFMFIHDGWDAGTVPRRSQIAFRRKWVKALIASWMRGKTDFYVPPVPSDYSIIEDDDVDKNDATVPYVAAESLPETGEVGDKVFFLRMVNHLYEECGKHFKVLPMQHAKNLEMTRMLIQLPGYSSPFVDAFIGTFMVLYAKVCTSLNKKKFVWETAGDGRNVFDRDTDFEKICNNYSDECYEQAISFSLMQHAIFFPTRLDSSRKDEEEDEWAPKLDSSMEEDDE